MSKVCCHCGEEKPLTEFYQRARASDGYQSRCKVCHGLHNKDHYQRNKELYKQRVRERRERLKQE